MDVEWDAMETLWNRIYDTELELPGSECVVSCTVSPYGPDSYAETLAEILFEEISVPGLYFALPGLMHLCLLRAMHMPFIDRSRSRSGEIEVPE